MASLASLFQKVDLAKGFDLMDGLNLFAAHLTTLGNFCPCLTPILVLFGPVGLALCFLREMAIVI